MLNYLKIKGSSFDVGVALGQFGAESVHTYLTSSDGWKTVMQWRDSAAIREMRKLVQERHPEYWLELQGLAKGLNLSFDEVFLWNCRGDVWAMSPDGCTTVQQPIQPFPAFAHNEDGDPGFTGKCGIAEIEVRGATRFASFVYPGSLPGHTFAVSDSGLAMTVNNLRSLHGGVGLPRMILSRAMLDQLTLDAALLYLRDAPRAGGFHFTLGQAGCPELFSVEFTSGKCSVISVKKPSLHANHMVHSAMNDQPQIVTQSSGYRQSRGDHLICSAVEAKTAVDPLKILFDQENDLYPIFRCAPDDSDNENTMATANIQLHADDVIWQIHTQDSETPVFSMRNGGQT